MIDDAGVELRCDGILDGLPIFSIVGSVDDWGVHGLRSALARAQRYGSRGLIACLDWATYFAAAAFGALNTAVQRMSEICPRQLIVVCSSRHIATRVLQLLDFKHRKVDTLTAALLLVRCAVPASAAQHSSIQARAFRASAS